MKETSLFDLYQTEFSDVAFEPLVIKNERDSEALRLLRAQQEANLSPFAFKTSQTRGRMEEDQPCSIRTCYERDYGRIVFSLSFRRLRHKTQVFFNPVNDHICSRIEHVIYVNYISTIIARALNLNVDLVQAIAMGHDVGHAPFGHSGERVLSECMKNVDENLFFEHEQQSLRVLDLLEVRSNPEKRGLNLSFEVRDGIVSHCGETYNESCLIPKRDKTTDSIVHKSKGDRTAPATLEGCVVRFADKIAYVGRDMEDAYRAGFIGSDYLPREVITRLGASNSEVINTLVGDIVHNSLDRDEIRMSEETFGAMNEFLNRNVNEIYKAKKIMTYEQTVNITVKALFEAFYEATADLEKSCASHSEIISKFAKFAINHPEPDCHPAVKVADYISGMTDTYCQNCFDALFRV